MGDGVALRRSFAPESGPVRWCSMTIGKRRVLRCELAVRGSGPARKQSSLGPLALKVARVRSNTSGEGVQNCNPLLARFPIQSPHAQRCDFAILAIFACINPPDRGCNEESLGIPCGFYAQVLPDVRVQVWQISVSEV